MYLLDTDILIWMIRGKKKYLSWFYKLKGKITISISTLTIAEIYKNIYPTELIRTEQLIDDCDILDVTSSIAKQGGLYYQMYIKKLRNLHIIDCIIAATAREHELTLLTLNTRHFPMSDIRLIEPKLF